MIDPSVTETNLNEHGSLKACVLEKDQNKYVVKDVEDIKGGVPSSQGNVPMRLTHYRISSDLISLVRAHVRMRHLLTSI